jgi:hypothetical protein
VGVFKQPHSVLESNPQNVCFFPMATKLLPHVIHQ